MQKCRHDHCRCEGLEAFEGYCSSYCAQAARRPDPSEGRGCGCGHPPCGDSRP
jgi:hypothetical protein